MGNPENRGGNALNNEGGRNDAFDVWSKALASKASWEERAKQIAKEVKGGVPSWKDNEGDGIEWTDISVDTNINKPDNTNDANLAGEPAKDEYIYHISPEDVRGIDPALVVDITGILNAKKK